MAYARDLSAAQGQRWTEMRALSYEALVTCRAAMTAYQLIDRLSHKTGRDIKPASVYRALEALSALGLIVKIESLNAFRACCSPREKHQHVFLVCGSCGHTDEMADHGIATRLTKDAQSHGFRTSRQVLELHGDCQSCQK